MDARKEIALALDEGAFEFSENAVLDNFRATRAGLAIQTADKIIAALKAAGLVVVPVKVNDAMFNARNGVVAAGKTEEEANRNRQP